MRWLAYALGGLVALVLLVTVVGALLPRDHVAAVTARIAAPADTVYATLADPAGFATWRGDVRRVKLLPATPTGPAWREHGGNGAVAYAVDAAEPPRRLVVRITDTGLPYGGAWEYTVETDGAAASRVTIVERGSVYNPIFRVVSRFVVGHTGTMTAQLRALGRKFGAEPTPHVVALEAPGASRGL
jgi:uncharacterized protein YndB with AHSA1/START domain